MTLTRVDGGADYYAKFAHPLPTDATFFPIGVWFESATDQSDIDKDKANGLNTYAVLTGDSNMGLVQQNGMHFIGQSDWFNNAAAQSSPSTNGWFLGDEIDMNDGPGAGYTTMQNANNAAPADNRIRYANYGKGVLFWETDAEASQFVNQYQNLVSTDAYWFTDNDLCLASQGGSLLGLGRDLTPGECHRASNYGRTIDRVRNLVSPHGRMPVWGFVELGHPASEASWPTITGPQTKAAVWSSLIHGARGIVYFNHSFGGPIIDAHLDRDYPDIAATVQQIDSQINELAPVLNADTVTGLLTTTGDVDTMVKWYNGHYYLFTGSNSTGGPTTATFALAGITSGTATVLDENRTVPITGGRFSDTFVDPNAYHIYRID